MRKYGEFVAWEAEQINGRAVSDGKHLKEWLGARESVSEN